MVSTWQLTWSYYLSQTTAPSGYSKFNYSVVRTLYLYNSGLYVILKWYNISGVSATCDETATSSDYKICGAIFAAADSATINAPFVCGMYIIKLWK